MNPFSSLLFPESLYTRLVIWFLLIALLPLGWITFITYEISKNILVEQASHNLTVLSQQQAESIENYFLQKEKLVAYLSKEESSTDPTEEFENALSKFGKESDEYKALENKWGPTLSFRAKLLGFTNLFLVTKNGEIVFSTEPSKLVGINLNMEAFQSSQLKEIFDNAKNLLETEISSITFYHPLEPPASFIAAPLLNIKDILVGVIILQLNNEEIFRLISNHSGLGQTGETILVTQAGNKIISQSPLRFDTKSNFIHYLQPNTPFEKFAKEIFTGKRLISKVTDYRGKETLMVGRYLLPTLHWGIITKIDVDELIAPINRLKFISLLMALTTAIIVFLTASKVASNITHPLLVLTKKTRLMAAGDLSQNIEIGGKDEIGRLAKSFNEMAAKLNNMIQHLDTIVATRTEEVELQNNKLEKTIEELKEAQNRLISQEKLASLGALTAGIAHEIKNPLNFVNNFAELSIQIEKDMENEVQKIKEHIPESDYIVFQEYLSTLKVNLSKIYDHGKRSDSIVQSMLHHSRGTSGEFVLSSINDLINESIALSYHGMRAQDPSFNVKIEKDLDPHIPQISISPQEINRVFLNILNNSYYSVREKKKILGNAYTPIVKITAQYQWNQIIIKIWDNGEGISPDIFPDLFTPFFSTKPAGEGTGLGLSISYNIIVQGHQGTLTADSKFGEFAEFVITLPVK